MPHGGSFKDLAKIVSGSGRHVEQAHDCVAKWCNCRFVHSTFNTITFRTILQPIDADHFFCIFGRCFSVPVDLHPNLPQLLHVKIDSPRCGSKQQRQAARPK